MKNRNASLALGSLTVLAACFAALAWLHQPARTVAIGPIQSISGSCERNDGAIGSSTLMFGTRPVVRSRICLFAVDTDVAKVSVVGAPFQIGEEAQLTFSRSNGLKFCASDICTSAAIADARADVFTSLDMAPADSKRARGTGDGTR